MARITPASFRNGMIISFRGEPSQILSFQHVNPGRGSAFVRTKLKNVTTGRVQEYTFKSGESAEQVSVVTREMQYLYKDKDIYVFMDATSFEQHEMSKKAIREFEHFLKEGQTYQVFVQEDTILGMRFPKNVTLEVIEAPEGTKGNTSTSATKTVTLESGLSISVPLFVKKGDVVKINTETKEYIERA